MPLLGGLIASLFTGLAGWLATFMGQKLAFATAAVASFSFLTVALFAALAALLSTLSTAFPSGIVFTTFLWLVLPPQVPIGISAIIAADTAIGLYAWNVRNVGLAASSG